MRFSALFFIYLNWTAQRLDALLKAVIVNLLSIVC